MKKSPNPAAQVLRGFAAAARFPAGAGLVGAPAAFFLGKITFLLMVLAMITGAVFGLTAVLLDYVAMSADPETSMRRHRASYRKPTRFLSRMRGHKPSGRTPGAGWQARARSPLRRALSRTVRQQRYLRQKGKEISD